MFASLFYFYFIYVYIFTFTNTYVYYYIYIRFLIVGAISLYASRWPQCV